MKKNKTIYNQPRRYARLCNIPLKYARLICKGQLKIRKDIYKNYKCPFCGKRALEIDSDDRDYSCQSWAYCDNCGETFDFEDYPKVRVPNVGEDFDIILWFGGEYSQEFDSLEEWHKFVRDNAINWLKDN